MSRKASKEPSIRDDLLTAAEFLTVPDTSLDRDDACRIGLRLAELANTGGMNGKA